mmetsp:Transcript_16889/g.65944  ORF Transcript_16889/g.65944 Transcript_16889/m.65944 type:complete len:269 (-) Transcript_16889:198-1004(-)
MSSRSARSSSDSSKVKSTPDSFEAWGFFSFESAPATVVSSSLASSQPKLSSVSSSSSVYWRASRLRAAAFSRSTSTTTLLAGTTVGAMSAKKSSSSSSSSSSPAFPVSREAIVCGNAPPSPTTVPMPRGSTKGLPAVVMRTDPLIAARALISSMVGSLVSGARPSSFAAISTCVLSVKGGAWSTSSFSSSSSSSSQPHSSATASSAPASGAAAGAGATTALGSGARAAGSLARAARAARSCSLRASSSSTISGGSTRGPPRHPNRAWS